MMRRRATERGRTEDRTTMDNKRLVLGLGGTVDYEIVWDSGVLEGLIREYDIRADELTTSVPVTSERALVVTLLAFVRDGVGGERFVASSEIIETFSARFQREITLGGTCVRAAIAMRTLGVTCTLHLVSIDDHVRRLLPEGCAYICSAEEDSTDPHLIVQFGAGVRVAAGDIDFTAPHPNRIIYANDPPNRDLVIAEELGDVLSTADVFMVAGFNVIQDEVLLEERLARIAADIDRMPAGSLVFYEDAGYHIPAFATRVRDRILDRIDVYSMNEDEMQAYLGRGVDLLDVDDVEKALEELHAVIPARTLVVHTKYWSLARGERAGELRAALQGGITMASTRYCYGDGFTVGDYEAVGRLAVHEDGAVLGQMLEARDGGSTAAVPAFVLDTATPTTIGLGDTFVGGFIEAWARDRVPA
jgi:ADP-dependent phosphofructokinase/glucokinase